jgi:uncharacterized damage-inducible protein DinB
MDISKPTQGTYPDYFNNYIKLIPELNIMELMLIKHYETIDLITSIDEETQHYRYEEDKWNIKEIIQHLIDCERIFAYRALSIARGEKQSLPGFDENNYAVNSHATRRNMNDLAREFSVLRASSIELFKSFSNAELDFVGLANGKSVTVRALLFATLGHEIHHMNIIEERYLKDMK